MEKVSIVIPNFNQADYLPACFDHCWFQTYPDLEIIVVDGGSTDGTKAWLAGLEQEIATRTVSPVLAADAAGTGVVRKTCRVYHEDTHTAHPRRELVIVSSAVDLGRVGTYNAGFARATGTYCTYVVGDDLPHPHFVEDLVEVLEATGADLAYADFRVVDDAGQVLRQVRKPEYSFDACFAQWFHLGVATLHRRSLHERVGLMDPAWDTANDYAWYLKMAETRAHFVHVPRVLYSVRYHGHGPELLDESLELARRARVMRTGNHPA
jgi:glycosyltransferase involved in cell wall biosynthesis